LTRRGTLFAVVAVTLGAAACGPKLPRIDTACGPLPLQDQSASGASQCGPTLDFVPVNQYRGEITAVQDREDAVALIGGTCTGTLIAAADGPVVLTAGHCGQLGDQFVVSFNVEADPDGDPLTTTGTVIERADAPDYALLRLDALPAVAPTPLTTQTSDLLAVIQHPRGGPKVVAEGQYLGACNGVIYYANLDTLVGSSGAGVLTRHGYLAGVHTDGDCATDGNGANRGWSSAAIVDASAYLQDVDIADR
jgi:trypsin-like peptidase